MTRNDLHTLNGVRFWRTRVNGVWEYYFTGCQQSECSYATAIEQAQTIHGWSQHLVNSAQTTAHEWEAHYDKDNA